MRKAMWAVALAIAFSTGPAWATNGIRMIGFGPVQDSMGGASIGAPLDAASVLSNPAGMSQLGGRMDFGSALFGTTVKAQLDSGFSEVTSDRPPSPIPAFGLVLPINKELSFGLGAYGVAGLGVDFRAATQTFADGLIPLSTMHTSFSQLRFAPGLSYKVSDELSLGATANLMYGALGLQFAGVSWPETASYGIGATVGATYKPMKELMIGLAYESPGWFQDYKFDASGVDIFGLTGTQGASIRGVDKLDFDMPMSASLGAGYTMGDLVVALDVQWINWSGPFGKNKPKWTSSETDIWSLYFADSLDVDWKDQWVFKIGLQYDAKPVKIRVGYNYGTDILEKTRGAQNLAFPAIAQHHVTAGVGVALTERTTVNVGGMYSPESKLTSSAVLPLGSVTTVATMTQWDVNLGIGYAF